MISEGYEKALFESRASDRYAVAQPADDSAGDKKVRVRNLEFDFVRDLRKTAQVVKRVVGAEDILFKVVERRHPRGVLAIEATSVGAQFMQLHKVTQEEMELYFPKHGFNPYVELLFKARKDRVSDLAHGDFWSVTSHDDFDSEIRPIRG